MHVFANRKLLIAYTQCATPERYGEWRSNSQLSLAQFSIFNCSRSKTPDAPFAIVPSQLANQISILTRTFKLVKPKTCLLSDSSSRICTSTTLASSAATGSLSNTSCLPILKPI